MAAGNIKNAQAHQAKTYNAKHARNDFEVGAKVWKKNPLWNTKPKKLKKGPMWRFPYKVEGKTAAGNYLLKGVKGKGKGKVRNTAIPLNQLKRYKARSQNIQAKSDDEYASESDGDDDQGPPISTNSPVSSDAATVLYAASEDDKGIPGCSSGVLIPGHTSSSEETIEIELGQIPGHTSSCDSDDTIEIDYAHIYSHIQYCISVWGPMMSQSQINELYLAQKSCLKHMFNKPKTYNTDHLFRELDLLKLQDIITLEQCKLGYKLVNNKIPNSIKKLMQQKGGKKKHRYNT